MTWKYAKILAAAKLDPIDFNLLPFSPKEANAIKDWLQKSRAAQQVNGATVDDKYWREIRAAAQLANTSKSFEAICLKRSRLGQKLKRIATARRPKNIPINSAVVAALAFGAARLGLITYPNPVSECIFRKKLSALSHDEINDSAEQAIKEPLLSSNKGGRPSEDALNSYIFILLKIYKKACGKQLPTKSIYRDTYMKWKPLLDFVHLCLPKETLGVIPIALIRKAVTRVRQSI